MDGGLVLDSIAARHGLFVKQTPRLYSLAHLSFQEYFAAKDIVDNLQHGSLERLLDHMGDDQWREVFLLTASALRRKDAPAFFEMFIQRLNKRVEGVEPIQQWLHWAAKKQAEYSCQMLDEGVSLRAQYHDLAYMFDIDLDRALHEARPLYHPNYLGDPLDLILGSVLGDAYNFSRDLARANINAEHAFAHAGARNLYEESGLYDLRDRVDALVLPLRNALPREWGAYEDALNKIANEAHNLLEIDYVYQWSNEDRQIIRAVIWNREQAAVYAAYLNGTALLIDCLQLAMVTDQESIEERLLLPVGA